MDEVLSSLNIPLKPGDLVTHIMNSNGFIEVGKYVIVSLNGLRVKILGVKGCRYLYGRSINDGIHSYKIRRTSVYGRMVTQVVEGLAKQDPNFQWLLNSKEYKALFG